MWADVSHSVHARFLSLSNPDYSGTLLCAAVAKRVSGGYRTSTGAGEFTVFVGIIFRIIYFSIFVHAQEVIK